MAGYFGLGKWLPGRGRRAKFDDWSTKPVEGRRYLATLGQLAVGRHSSSRCWSFDVHGAIVEQ